MQWNQPAKANKVNYIVLIQHCWLISTLTCSSNECPSTASHDEIYQIHRGFSFATLKLVLLGNTRTHTHTGSVVDDSAGICYVSKYKYCPFYLWPLQFCSRIHFNLYAWNDFGGKFRRVLIVAKIVCFVWSAMACERCDCCRWVCAACRNVNGECE